MGKNNYHDGLIIYRRIISNLKNAVVNKFLNNPIYQKFIAKNILNQNKYKATKKSLYNLSNSLSMEQSSDELKYYISIDLIAANFNSCRLYDKDLVFGFESWEDLLCSVNTELGITEIDNFKLLIRSNKYLRQIIFGQLNCNKIMSFSRYLIDQVCDQLITNKVIEKDQLILVMHDEIIIRSGFDHVNLVDRISQVLQNSICNIYPILRIQSFDFRNFEKLEFYIKRVWYDHIKGSVMIISKEVS